MPKDKKKQEESESSGSESREESPPPPKKKKAPPPAEDEDPTWVLGEKRLVKVREFRGKVMVDIREYYEDKGELKPGKKGISLSTSQWYKLKNLVSEIDAAVKSKC